jgi:putative aldouronate transport system substrate-binding protein
MKKRLLALLLAMCLLCGLMAACGSSSSSTTTTTTEETASASDDSTQADATEATAAETETASEAPAATEEAAASEEPATTKLSEDLITLTYWQAWPPFLSSISEPQDAAMFAELQEILNVKLEITAVDTETSSEKLSLMCASGEMTDMIQGMKNYSGGATKALDDEVIIDLLPLVEEYAPNYYSALTSDDTVYKAVLDDDGKMPQLLGMYTEYYYTDQGFFIRKDSLDQVGMDLPTTVADLEEILEAFHTELGMTDAIVILSGGSCSFLSTAMGASDYVQDGQLISQATSDEMKAYFKKMNEWYEKGYINADFPSYTDSDTKPPESVVTTGNAGMFNEDVDSISTYYDLMSDVEGFEMSALPQVKLNADDELHTGYIGKLVSDKYTVAISSNCSAENQVYAIKYLDYLFSEEGEILANYGIENDTYTLDDSGKPQFTDKILNNEQFDWQLCQSLFINPGFPCISDLSVNRMTYNQCQLDAVDIWNQNFTDSSMTAPTDQLTYTSDESSERALYSNDIETYQEEMGLKFITGAADIDAEWDNYCATLKSMGIDTITEIDQAAYERYLNR